MERNATCGGRHETGGEPRSDPAVGPSVRALQSRLGFAGAIVPRRVGLYLPTALSFEEWEKVGTQLCIVYDSSAWWLGDWLVYGQDAYGDRYKRAVTATALDYQTLRNYAWVARRYPMSRRRDKLSFQHHAEVAALSEDEQEVWLDRACLREWSRNELRRQRGAARSALARGEAPEPVVLRVSVDGERERRWQEAAERMAFPLDEWMALVLDQAAHIVLDPADEAGAEWLASRGDRRSLVTVSDS